MYRRQSYGRIMCRWKEVSTLIVDHAQLSLAVAGCDLEGGSCVAFVYFLFKFQLSSTISYRCLSPMCVVCLR